MSGRSLAVVPAWRWWAGFFLISAIAVGMTIVAYRGELPAVFDRVHQLDKAVHFGFAGLLAFFLDGALRRRALVRVGSASIPLAAAGVLVPAGIEEYLQRYALWRTSSLWDFVADVAGVVAFIALSRRAAK